MLKSQEKISQLRFSPLNPTNLFISTHTRFRLCKMPNSVSKRCETRILDPFETTQATRIINFAIAPGSETGLGQEVVAVLGVGGRVAIMHVDSIGNKE